MRRKLLQDPTEIEIEDFGAGSTIIKTNRRKVSRIAETSLKTRNFSQLLFRIVQYYKPAVIVELGTSLGITTSYLANGNRNARIHSLEGASSIATIAERNFQVLSLNNVEILRGDFEFTLPHILHNLDTVNLAFIDGNHRKEPTLKYFHQLLTRSVPSTILIFDDIHWSSEMEAAWTAIKDDPAVTLTIDLFFIGLVFINPDFKVKQHFKIRF